MQGSRGWAIVDSTVQTDPAAAAATASETAATACLEMFVCPQIADRGHAHTTQPLQFRLRLARSWTCVTHSSLRVSERPCWRNATTAQSPVL
eukprot:scaffold5296_cov105-Isochrysis_galbana.AAC.2